MRLSCSAGVAAVRPMSRVPIKRDVLPPLPAHVSSRDTVFTKRRKPTFSAAHGLPPPRPYVYTYMEKIYGQGVPFVRLPSTRGRGFSYSRAFPTAFLFDLLSDAASRLTVRRYQRKVRRFVQIKRHALRRAPPVRFDQSRRNQLARLRTLREGLSILNRMHMQYGRFIDNGAPPGKPREPPELHK